MIQLLKKHWYLFSLASIFFVAILIRFYQLGVIPHGMTWDEAAIGYNGHAVLTTRRDEWLERLPISFRSFGDYKAPLAIYLNGPFTSVFGMNLFAVRLPFAITSIFGILGIILLTRLLFSKQKLVNYYSLFAGFIMVLSPWHIHYSRAGFESGMSLAFFIWGLYFLIKSIKDNFKKQSTSLLGIIFFAAGIYTYHSAKVVIPLMLVVLFMIFFKQISKNFIKVFLPLLTFIVLLIPFIKDSLYGEGLTRAGVSIFSANISLQEKIVYVFQSYLAHLSPDFLLFAETTTLRHGTGYLGVLFLTTFVLVVGGFISFLNNKTKNRTLFLSLIFIGLLPACISMEVPHSNRSLLALPGFIIVALYGLDYFINKIRLLSLNKTVSGSHGEKDILVKLFVGTLIFLHIIFSVSFLNHYFTVFAKESSDSFKDGYLEAFDIAQKYEKGLENYPEVEKVIFTSKYGQPYIYALFARKTNPIWYQGGSLVKYEFYEEVTVGDLMRNNALIVGSNTDDLPIKKAKHIIYGSDGEMRFQIYKTESKE